MTIHAYHAHLGQLMIRVIMRVVVIQPAIQFYVEKMNMHLIMFAQHALLEQLNQPGMMRVVMVQFAI